MSTITLTELVHGAERSQYPVRNLAVVEDFCSRLITLDYADTEAYQTAISAQFWSKPVKTLE